LIVAGDSSCVEVLLKCVISVLSQGPSNQLSVNFYMVPAIRIVM